MNEARDAPGRRREGSLPTANPTHLSHTPASTYWHIIIKEMTQPISRTHARRHTHIHNGERKDQNGKWTDLICENDAFRNRGTAVGLCGKCLVLSFSGGSVLVVLNLTPTR